MSRTWKHQWKHKNKEHWKKWINEVRESKIIEIDGETYWYRSWLEQPKDRLWNPPIWTDNIGGIDRNKKWIKRYLWQKHRGQWKRALKTLDDKIIESLPRRPQRYAWILD